jgi:hypothetical protein
MTPPSQPKYIITREQLNAAYVSPIPHKMYEMICSYPYDPQAEREKVLDELIKWMLEQTNIVGSYGRVVKARYKEEIFERIFDKITELRQKAGEP